jgi:hypothetical protein
LYFILWGLGAIGNNGNMGSQLQRNATQLVIATAALALALGLSSLVFGAVRLYRSRARSAR